MAKLIDDKGIDEFEGVKKAQEELKAVLKRAADLKAYISEHQAGAEWLRLENEKEFDAVQKAADEALEDRLTITCSESAKIYDMLTKTPLYDKARGQWNWGMNEKQIIIESSRPSHIQLTGVIALASIGRIKEATEFYDKLTESALYDKTACLWNHHMSVAQQVESSGLAAYSQLSDVIALALIGRKEESINFYNLLEKTVLYDKERNQWNHEMNTKQKIICSDRHPYSQLLGVLALSLIGRKEESLEAYNQLMETPLYDESCGQWNYELNSKQELISSIRQSAEQLIGIAFMANNGMAKEANKLYTRLTKSELYDKERMQWNCAINADQQLQDTNRNAHIQLWGVAALAMLEAR
ncbi:MAG: hypothetical protein WC852_03505 [Candidatus Nanoarchaeia archaeon]|jgi:hypothetical protein